MKRTFHKRSWKIVLALLLIPGLCLTARALYLHAKAELAGILIRRAWQDEIKLGRDRTPWPWADTHPIARLQIPRLGYDEIVLEGATPRTLAFGPARLLTGVRFGEHGNLVLAGHRTSWFEPLKGIQQGDQIRIEWLDRRHKLRRRTFTVETIQITSPEELSLLGPTPEDTLTLITCYPFGSSPTSPERFIVRAIPDKQNQQLALRDR